MTLPPPPGRRPEGGVGALDVGGGQGHWEGIQGGTRDLGSHGGTEDSGSHGGTGDSGGHGGTRDLGGHGGAIFSGGLDRGTIVAFPMATMVIQARDI